MVLLGFESESQSSAYIRPALNRFAQYLEAVSVRLAARKDAGVRAGERGPLSHRCSRSDPQRPGGGGRVALGHDRPVHDVPPGGEVVATTVLVFQVVGRSEEHTSE